MNEPPQRMIPWQDRERIGSGRAFFMTLIEVFVAPFEYFERLRVKEDYHEPVTLIFYNSMYLASPLISDLMKVPAFLALVGIVAGVPVLIAAASWLSHFIFRSVDDRSRVIKAFYIIAYSTPAFVLIYIPYVGYWLAAIALVVFVGIGYSVIYKIDHIRLLWALAVIPLLVLGPRHVVLEIQEQERQRVRVDIEIEAQKVLAAISIAAENYAMRNNGVYPASVQLLVSAPEPLLAKNYCGQVIHSYEIGCDLRSFGYYLKATPRGWHGRGKKTYFVTTGGRLREL